METIYSSLITGSLALIGVIITCIVTSNKTRNDIMQEYRVSKAVTDTKIDELTREVREHNNFAKRMPVVENEIKHIKEDIHKYHDN